MRFKTFPQKLSLAAAMMVATVASTYFFTSCGKDTQFLYPVPPGVQHFDMARTVQSLQISTSRKADILWVVDNSNSMRKYHESVLLNAKSFIEGFIEKQSLNQWSMGVISTSVDEPPWCGFGFGPPGYSQLGRLDYLTSNVVDIFKDCITLLSKSASKNGYGDSNEQFINPVLNTVKGYPGFFRPDADLYIILITDDDDNRSKVSPYPEPAVFAKTMKELLGPEKGIFIYGVIGAIDLRSPVKPYDFCDSDTDDSNSTKSTGMAALKPGEHEVQGTYRYDQSRYWQTFQNFPTKIYPACDPEFGKNLTDIGRDIIRKSTIQSQNVILEGVPTGPIVIKYAGKILPVGPPGKGFWQYRDSDNSIKISSFDFAFDEPSTELEISFDGKPYKY